MLTQFDCSTFLCSILLLHIEFYRFRLVKLTLKIFVIVLHIIRRCVSCQSVHNNENFFRELFSTASMKGLYFFLNVTIVINPDFWAPSKDSVADANQSESAFLGQFSWNKYCEVVDSVIIDRNKLVQAIIVFIGVMLRKKMKKLDYMFLMFFSPTADLVPLFVKL